MLVILTDALQCIILEELGDSFLLLLLNTHLNYKTSCKKELIYEKFSRHRSISQNVKKRVSHFLYNKDNNTEELIFKLHK